MKKFLLSVLTLMLGVNLFAINYSGKITVAIYDGSHIANATVSESTDVAPGVIDNGYCNPVQDLGAMSVAIYAFYENVAYENLLLNSLKNMPLNFKANSATNYKLYFANKEGTISIYDTKTQAFIDLTTSPYNFTIEASERDANNIVANRFIINYFPGYDVTLNANGLATFSAEDAVSIPDGLKAYTATGLTNDVLTLSEITAKQVPANTGVILYGAADGDYQLPIIASAAAISGNNYLFAATVWPAAEGVVYILHGAELWQYTGSTMKANKAYLQLPANSAPARIRLAFDQATAVENVEAEAVKAEKFVENGQIFIRRGNEVFNLQGQKQR